MSNGTKPMGKDFKIESKLPRVILTFTGQQVMVELKNTNWEVAVDMLVDALSAARMEETKQRAKREKNRIVTGDPSQIPGLRT